jgi:NAD(P)-dependent dehydrogenase (short-subunit alcohol dehydrogenase family)
MTGAEHQEHDMTDLRFDGRVAVVTGAGRGLGRAHAILLAERGAAVVVNDLGGSMEGDGSDAGPAQSVVNEIVGAGGHAVADTSDVSTESGATAIIASAVDAFGRIDVLVNNAGIIKWGSLPEVDADTVERHLAVHLMGSFNTMRAAWPYFVEQQYGRVVLTTSSGMLGLDNNLSYAAAKSGLIGLARSTKLSGAPHGITVNLIAPAALTRMAGDESAQRVMPPMPPEAVAPMVAYLAHESCPVSGEIYTAGAGRFGRVFLGSTPGYLQRDRPATVEDIAQNWDLINDERGYSVPTDLTSWSASFLRHLYG